MCYKIVLMAVLTVGWAIWLIIYTNKEDTDADEIVELMRVNLTEKILI